MNEFNEKNRRLLHFYCQALRTIASMILILGLLGGCAMTMLALFSKFGYWHAPKSFDVNMTVLSPSFFKGIFFWIGVLGLVQFIRYLVEEDYKPGWILRHGDIFFYLYALFIILSVVGAYTTFPPGFLSPFSYMGVFKILMIVFSITIRILILVGLGQILRRIMPVIEESKSLV